MCGPPIAATPVARLRRPCLLTTLSGCSEVGLKSRLEIYGDLPETALPAALTAAGAEARRATPSGPAGVACPARGSASPGPGTPVGHAFYRRPPPPPAAPAARGRSFLSPPPPAPPASAPGPAAR